MGPLLPFEELVNENEVDLDDSSKIEEDDGCKAQEDSDLPNPQALLHVTSRKKASAKNKTVVEVCRMYFLHSLARFQNLNLVNLQVNINTDEIQAAYDDLLAKFESQVNSSLLA